MHHRRLEMWKIMGIFVSKQSKSYEEFLGQFLAQWIRHCSRSRHCNRRLKRDVESLTRALERLPLLRFRPRIWLPTPPPPPRKQPRIVQDLGPCHSHGDQGRILGSCIGPGCCSYLRNEPADRWSLCVSLYAAQRKNLHTHTKQILVVPTLLHHSSTVPLPITASC